MSLVLFILLPCHIIDAYYTHASNRKASGDTMYKHVQLNSIMSNSPAASISDVNQRVVVIGTACTYVHMQASTSFYIVTATPAI